MRKILLAIFILSVNYSRGQLSIMHDFAGCPDGNSTWGDLFFDGAYMYGMTLNGGEVHDYCPEGCGTIFKIKDDGTGYTVLFSFSDSITGRYPMASLISDGTYLYGMAAGGGLYQMGTIFKIKPDGTDYTKLMDFAGATNGAYPRSTFVSDGTYLYGMTQNGGIADMGTIFKIKPDGTSYQKLFDFDMSVQGGTPIGSLIYDGSYLYGIGDGASTNHWGTVFKIKTDGTDYTTLHNFTDIPDGNSPKGTLFSDGTHVYGMTLGGGINNKGTIFKVKTDGTGYSIIHHFGTGDVPRTPQGNSLIYDGTFLYGMTYSGGTGNNGTIFKIKTDGSELVKLWDFAFQDTANGQAPYGTLLLHNNILYGMTHSGGAYGYGIIFGYGPATSVNELSSRDNVFSIYPNPAHNQFVVESSEFIDVITIYDMMGREVFTTTLTCPATGGNSKHQTLNPNLSSGIYLVRVEAGDRLWQEKLIVE